MYWISKWMAKSPYYRLIDLKNTEIKVIQQTYAFQLSPELPSLNYPIFLLHVPRRLAVATGKDHPESNSLSSGLLSALSF